MRDNRESELAKNTLILSVGRFLPKLVSIITLPIITACLTKAEYGTFDLIQTLVMLVIPIATLQIQSAAFRFLIECRGDKKETRQIVSNIYIVTIPISLVASVVIFIVMSGFSTAIRVAISMYFLTDSIINTTGQVVRGLGGNFDYAISSVIMSVVNAIGIVAALSMMNTGLLGVLVVADIAHTISSIYLIVRKKVYRYISISDFSVQKIKELLSYSWPMVPNNLSSWVLKSSDRIVITGFLGVDANAVYAVANKIPNLLSLAQGVLVSAWQENASLAVKDKDADQYFTKMFDEIFSLMIGVTAVLIAFTPVMFAILIRGDYDDAYAQMPILILGEFFYAMSAFQGGIYIAHKKTRSVGITTIIAAIINLVIDLALVNLIGITAGSVSTLVAYLVLYIYRTIDSLKFQPMDYHIKKQLICLTVIILMLFLCLLRIFYLDIINIVLSIIVFLALNWDLTKSAIKWASSYIKRK